MMCYLIQDSLKIGVAIVVTATFGCATKTTKLATGNRSLISHATYTSKSNSEIRNRTVGESRHELRVKLSEGNNADLSWTDYAPTAAGYFVEYTNYLRDPFIPIAAFFRGTTNCRHPDLMPGTPFIYRIRPFFGPATKVVEIVTGKAPSQETAGEFHDLKPVPSGDKSLKVPATAAEAAASDLTATLPAPIQVQLNWKDNSRDEDGYLVEVADPNGEFKVCALLDANITSHVIGGLPPETKCSFRVRAYYCGRPSNNVRIMTRPDIRGKHQTETLQPVLDGS